MVMATTMMVMTTTVVMKIIVAMLAMMQGRGRRQGEALTLETRRNSDPCLLSPGPSGDFGVQIIPFRIAFVIGIWTWRWRNLHWCADFYTLSLELYQGFGRICRMIPYWRNMIKCWIPVISGTEILFSKDETALSSHQPTILVKSHHFLTISPFHPLSSYSLESVCSKCPPLKQDRMRGGGGGTF